MREIRNSVPEFQTPVPEPPNFKPGIKRAGEPLSLVHSFISFAHLCAPQRLNQNYQRPENRTPKSQTRTQGGGWRAYCCAPQWLNLNLSPNLQNVYPHQGGGRRAYLWAPKRVVHSRSVNPTPSALHPTPYTLHPKPGARKPKSEAPNPAKPQPPNPDPIDDNPKPRTPTPYPQIPKQLDWRGSCAGEGHWTHGGGTPPFIRNRPFL